MNKTLKKLLIVALISLDLILTGISMVFSLMIQEVSIYTIGVASLITTFILGVAITFISIKIKV